jgi:ABC-type Mn2+/Zn2+ transport system permease subunit
MLVIAVTIATSSAIAGTVVARVLHHDPGPVSIAITAAVFFVSLLRRKT